MTHPLSHHAANDMMNQASAVTYGGTATAFAFWGLHISDIAVIVSTLASVMGVVLQFYVTFKRIQTIEKQAAVAEVKADVAHVAVTALAQANRTTAAKVDKLESDAG